MAAFDTGQENLQPDAGANASPEEAAGDGAPNPETSAPGGAIGDPAMNDLVDRMQPGAVGDLDKILDDGVDHMQPGAITDPRQFIRLLPYIFPPDQPSEPDFATYQYGKDESDHERGHASLILGFSAKAPDDPEFLLKAARQFNTTPQAIAAGPDDFARRMAMQEANKALKGAPVLQRTIIRNAPVADLMHDDVGNATALEKNLRSAPVMTAWDGKSAQPTLRERISDLWRGVIGAPTVAEERKAKSDAEAWAILASKKPGMTNDEAWEASRQAIGGMSQVPQMFAEKLADAATFGLVAPTTPTDAHSWQADVAGAVGRLAGFLTGPLGNASAAVDALRAEFGLAHYAGETFVSALSKDAVAQAGKLALASGLEQAGHAALDTHTLPEAAKLEGDAIKSGAEAGGIFGAAGRILPDNSFLPTILRAAGVNAALDAAQGTSPGDSRPLQDKLFGYLLNTVSALRGAGPVPGPLHDAARARLAEQDHQNLQASSDLAANSRWRERDPKSFGDFVNALPGGNQTLHVDAQTLREKMGETGVSPDAMGETLPGVSGQLEKDGQADGHVSIPLPDYLTHLAGTSLGDAVLPHLKTDPEAMSHAEAQAFHGNLADAPARADGAQTSDGIPGAENATDAPQGAQPPSAKVDAEQGAESPDTRAEDDAIRARFAAKLQDHENAVAEYSKLEGSHGGKVLNTDIARELSPDYLENRTKAPVIQQQANAFVRRMYADKLAATEAPNVLFTAGGPGAGKTTALESVPKMANIKKQADIVYDTTMSGYESSKELIDQALRAGGTPRVGLVIRDPEDALVNGVLPRAADEVRQYGSARAMPLDYFINAHLGAMKTVSRLADEYKGDVDFDMIDNRRGKGNARGVSLEEAKAIKFENVEDRVKQALEKEYANGRISKEIYAGFKSRGNEP